MSKSAQGFAAISADGTIVVDTARPTAHEAEAAAGRHFDVGASRGWRKAQAAGQSIVPVRLEEGE